MKSFEIAAYYTKVYRKRSIKLQRDTPFCGGNQSVVKVFFRFVVCGLFLSRSPVKILVQIIQFSVESLYVFFSRFIGFLQGFFLAYRAL